MHALQLHSLLIVAVLARAWKLKLGQQLQGPLVLGVTLKSDLSGSWEPFPEYEGAGETVSFTTFLTNSTVTSGSVGLSGEDPVELNAAILRSRFAVAVW